MPTAVAYIIGMTQAKMHTSKANAGSLLKGDMIEILGKSMTILAHPVRWTSGSGQQFVSMDVPGQNSRVKLDFPINFPLDRVVGAR